MRVCGIDPGTIHTGFGVIDLDKGNHSLVFAETIHADQKKPLSERLGLIHRRLAVLLREWKPEVMAIENIFFYKDFKAAVKIGEARAAAMIAASDCGIPVIEYLPTRVKESICGNGRAAKTQVQYMVERILNVKASLDADSADAVAVALCHCFSLKFRQLQRKEPVYV